MGEVLPIDQRKSLSSNKAQLSNATGGGWGVEFACTGSLTHSLKISVCDVCQQALVLNSSRMRLIMTHLECLVFTF